ncbi:MAG: GatB/YqeY domain-containing protein [Dehalococcoidia bacterium]|nr:GatB/YqeY domain-containing protein [Dehalococcoidia bacterium]
MSIKQRLDDDLKAAMKAGETITRDTIRLIRAAILNREKEKGGAPDDRKVVDVLSRMSRQYRESIETYRGAGRNDLAAKEQAELDVLTRYLPRQLTREEVTELAERAAAEVGASGPGDRGKVMGKLMPQVRGQADGTMVNEIVGEILQALAERGEA